MHHPEVEIKLKESFTLYTKVIKPLIADLEAKTQHFPPELFNEIRAFTDHLARCYTDGATKDYCLEEIEKAKGHFLRTLLDVYKYLVLFLYDYVNNFESKADFDLSYIDNGIFIKKLRRMKLDAQDLVRRAKEKESMHKDEAIALYEKAYNKYTEIQEFIFNSDENINWARDKFRNDLQQKLTDERNKRKTERSRWIWGTVLSAVISFAFGFLVNYLIG